MEFKIIKKEEEFVIIHRRKNYIIRRLQYEEKTVFLGVIAAVLTLALSGCALLDSKVHSLRGTLAGVSYNAEFYDNYGAKFLNVSGERIDIEGNVTEESGFDSDGSTTINYSL